MAHPNRKDHQAQTLVALRALGGRATLADLVSATGISNQHTRDAVRALLESHRGHLEVTSSGELIYSFDPGLIRRDHRPFWARMWSGVRPVLKQGFKAWIMAMLLVYFVVYVTILVATVTLVALSNRRNPFRGLELGARAFGLLRRPMGYQAGHSPRRKTKSNEPRPTTLKATNRSFIDTVFSFAFGPGTPKTPEPDLDTIRLIRAREGVISAVELVEHSGLPLPEAEEEMGRLVGAYDGEPLVSPNGEIVYAFPALMTSALGDVAADEPPPAWHRLEYAAEVTGNSENANILIGGINLFNLSMALLIGSAMGLPQAASMSGTSVFLVVVPAVFSVLLFALPIGRWVEVARENRRRATRNLRRVLLAHIFGRTVSGGSGVSVGGAAADARVRHRGRDLALPAGPDASTAASEVATLLEGNQIVQRDAVERVLVELATEFDADVAPDEEGVLHYTFPEIQSQFTASEVVRRQLALDERSLGEVVYSTADTPEEATKRDLALFDRELTPGESDFARYVPSLDRVVFEEDDDSAPPAAAGTKPRAP